MYTYLSCKFPSDHPIIMIRMTSFVNCQTAQTLPCNRQICGKSQLCAAKLAFFGKFPSVFVISTTWVHEIAIKPGQNVTISNLRGKFSGLTKCGKFRFEDGNNARPGLTQSKLRLKSSSIKVLENIGLTSNAVKP